MAKATGTRDVLRVTLELSEEEAATLFQLLAMHVNGGGESREVLSGIYQAFESGDLRGHLRSSAAFKAARDSGYGMVTYPHQGA